MLRSIRSSFNRFIERHSVAWELGMAGLAIAFVVIGFASDLAPAEYQATLGAADLILTVVFIAEFASRFLASESHVAYLKSHSLDLVALMPIARGLRIARLLRLLRLVRAFTGVSRAFTGVDRLASHHDLGNLVIAWFGTMLLCSSAFYAVESGANPLIREPADAVWWGIATLTGGTAEVHAVTDEGRLATAVLLVLGVALFTAITAVLVSFMVSGGKPTTTQMVGRLREAAALRDDGTITVEQFDALRAQVLAKLAAS
jgi:voltage-gated potassium channel